MAGEETRKWPSGTAGLLAQNPLLHITAAITLAGLSPCVQGWAREKPRTGEQQEEPAPVLRNQRSPGNRGIP